MNAMIDDRGARSGAASRTPRYAFCIKASKKVRWDIDADVLRGRQLDFPHKFLPDGLSRVAELGFLTAPSGAPEPGAGSHLRVSLRPGRALHRRQGAGAVKRALLGDQVALEALVRFSDEELKHQELFRRVEALIARGMPGGLLDGRRAERGRARRAARSPRGLCSRSPVTSSCSCRATTSTASTRMPQLSPLFKDIFRYHWMEECQHVILDELEWRRVDARAHARGARQACRDLIDLVGAVDGILQAQAAVDCGVLPAPV